MEEQSTVHSAISDWLSRQHNSGKRATALIAAQLGSKAWGYPTESSDTDVTFLYVRGASSYLSLSSMPQQTPQMRIGKVELVGWDLKKFLALLVTGNPTAQEILLADHFALPFGYLLQQHKIDDVYELAKNSYDPSKAFMAYRGTAFKINRDRSEVKLERRAEAKRILTILRYLCACIHIYHYAAFPPLPIQDVISAKPLAGSQVEDTILSLIHAYTTGDGTLRDSLLANASRAIDSLAELVDVYKPRMEVRALTEEQSADNFDSADRILRSFIL